MARERIGTSIVVARSTKSGQRLPGKEADSPCAHRLSMNAAVPPSSAARPLDAVREAGCQRASGDVKALSVPAAKVLSMNDRTQEEL
jgi:hypothetical protein